MTIIARLDRQKHRNIMKSILIDIYKDFELGTALVFKGGTASYFFYGLDRFSTDLNFDLLLDTIQISEDQISKKLSSILAKYGEVKRRYNKRNTIFLLLSYGNIDHNIKIEISKRGISGEYEKVSWLGVSVLVMTEKSIFTNKLFTLLNRTNLANRDIYDIYFFFKKSAEFNIKLLEEKSGKEYIFFLKNIVTLLINLPKHHSILEGLGEVLQDEKHKSFVKNKLIQELIEQLEFYIKFSQH